MIILQKMSFIRIQDEGWKIFCSLIEGLEMESSGPSGPILFRGLFT